MASAEREQSIAGVRVWQPLRGPIDRWPHAADFVFALLAFALTLAMWSQRSEPGSLQMLTVRDLATYLCAFVGNFALLWRRTHPLYVHFIILFASLLVQVGSMNHGIVALVFSLYSLGRYEADHRASIIGVTAAAVFYAIDLFIPITVDVSAFVAVLSVVGVWYVGRRLRFRGEYLRLLEERAAHLEREKDVESERAVAAERTRIARDMHDIVAHQVSLMTVQAGAAKTVSASDPAAANDAMAAVEQAGRTALSEMRDLLNVLRPADDRSVLSPQPGLEALPALVHEVTEIGPSVQLTINHDLSLPARIELTIYRIVQEALTNVIKHAGDEVRVAVTVSVNDAGVVVCVVDDGQANNINKEPGHGIAGMRERAELVDGTLTAGKRAQGGFEVRAVLPFPGHHK